MGGSSRRIAAAAASAAGNFESESPLGPSHESHGPQASSSAGLRVGPGGPRDSDSGSDSAREPERRGRLGRPRRAGPAPSLRLGLPSPQTRRKLTRARAKPRRRAPRPSQNLNEPQADRQPGLDSAEHPPRPASRRATGPAGPDSVSMTVRQNARIKAVSVLPFIHVASAHASWPRSW